jgi:hypothetical protein
LAGGGSGAGGFSVTVAPGTRCASGGTALRSIGCTGSAGGAGDSTSGSGSFSGSSFRSGDASATSAITSGGNAAAAGGMISGGNAGAAGAMTSGGNAGAAGAGTEAGWSTADSDLAGSEGAGDMPAGSTTGTAAGGSCQDLANAAQGDSVPTRVCPGVRTGRLPPRRGRTVGADAPTSPARYMAGAAGVAEGRSSGGDTIGACARPTVAGPGGGASSPDPAAGPRPDSAAGSKPVSGAGSSPD